MGKKKDEDWFKSGNIEDHIQEEIQNRVISESMTLQDNKEKLEREKINLDVLEEMSDLPRERIEAIADEVRQEILGKKTGKGKPLLRSFIAWGIAFLFLAAVAVFAVIRFQNNSPPVETEKPIATEVLPLTTTRRDERRPVDKDVPKEVKTDYASLVAAVKNGNRQMVVFLLDKGTPMYMTGFEKTLLHEAVDAGYINIVKLLMDRGAVVTYDEISAAEDSGNVSIVNMLCRSFVDTSPAGSGIRKLWNMGFSFSEKSLIKCIQENNLPAIRLFVEEGVIVSTASLKTAVKSGSPEALGLLLTNKDKFRYKNKYDPSTILSIAAGEGKADMFTLLLKGLTGIRKVDADNLLINVSGKENLDIVKALVEWGADIEYSPKGNAPLHYAATPAIADYLLQKGANPDIKNASGRTPIMARIYAKNYINSTENPDDVEIVKLLLKFGADIHIRDNQGKTAFDCAKEMNSPEIEKLLRNAGANLSLTNENFIISATNGDISTLKACLKNGIDADTKDRHGDTALIIATKKENTDVMKILLENGANPNLQEIVGLSEKGDTPLIMAISKGNLKNVKLLLDHKADVNAGGRFEKLPFSFAIQKIGCGSAENEFKQSVAIVKLLISSGLDLKSESSGKAMHDALSKAIYCKKPDLVRYLLDKGADSNQKNTYGTPVILQHQSIWETDIMKALLEYGANVNATDKRGNTALMLASKSGVVETVRLLLKNGADASIKDKKGKTAFDMCKNDEIKKLLSNTGK